MPFADHPEIRIDSTEKKACSSNFTCGDRYAVLDGALVEWNEYLSE